MSKKGLTEETTENLIKDLKELETYIINAHADHEIQSQVRLDFMRKLRKLRENLEKEVHK